MVHVKIYVTKCSSFNKTNALNHVQVQRRRDEVERLRHWRKHYSWFWAALDLRPLRRRLHLLVLRPLSPQSTQFHNSSTGRRCTWRPAHRTRCVSAASRRLHRSQGLCFYVIYYAKAGMFRMWAAGKTVWSPLLHTGHIWAQWWKT